MTQALETLLPCQALYEALENDILFFDSIANHEQWEATGIGNLCRGYAARRRELLTAWNTRKPCDAGLREAQAQRLQDHMEQFHGVCLKASEWDAAIAALSKGDATR